MNIKEFIENSKEFDFIESFEDIIERLLKYWIYFKTSVFEQYIKISKIPK